VPSHLTCRRRSGDGARYRGHLSRREILCPLQVERERLPTDGRNGRLLVKDAITRVAKNRCSAGHDEWFAGIFQTPEQSADDKFLVREETARHEYLRRNPSFRRLREANSPACG